MRMVLVEKNQEKVEDLGKQKDQEKQEEDNYLFLF
jgi:hypothetical protein